MDRRRADIAGQQPEPVPTPASTTTGQLAKRFTATYLAGIENGIGAVNARVLALVSPRRRTSVGGGGHDRWGRTTTDVEVCGRKKQDAVDNYQGLVSTDG